jgi:hypothetical protein
MKAEAQGGLMKTLGNILWIVLGGLPLAVSWAVAGLLCCITIVGIPLGKQCFKIAGLALTPFGKHVECSKIGVTSCLGNVLWILIFGITLFLESLLLGVVLCITIIGIPFGLQHFKLAKLAIWPFGAKVE